ncbi:inositol-3-phosphate synthase [Candidatus Bathyarchaeota archaeon ex4484_40]|nr:MAG: inositol-3-phosphate synthase [Candidatus Bathyarchaeota archaeon ex4484_40]
MSKAKIKVALAGVGNCASALIQGVEYYRHAQREEEAVGLSHLYLGGYHPRDIEFVCAFDVASGKVGADLSEAIFTHPNNTIKIADVPKIGVKVLRGPLMDGVSGPLSDVITVDESEEVDVASALKDSGAEILLNLLPSGASEASKRYAEESLKAGCAFVNVTPTILASDPEWAGRFKEKGLPVVGDDLTDQVGATIIHKALLETLSRRGVRISETYQLDVGGGAESLNPAEIVAGSTDYVDFLGNRRDSYFWLRGLYFGGVPMRLDIKLSTVDGPNAGSVLLDVIRAVKIALNRGEAGHVLAISAYAFKRPAEILPPDEAERLFEAFVKSG